MCGVWRMSYPLSYDRVEKRKRDREDEDERPCNYDTTMRDPAST
jgi:hypothetical protein